MIPLAVLEETARQRAAATRQNGRSRSETETDETAHIA
jgi:hypothetical protein